MALLQPPPPPLPAPPGISTVTYVFVYSPSGSGSGPGGAPGAGPGVEHTPHAAHAPLRGPKRKLYSAVPGRKFIAVKSYTPHGEGEIQLNRGEAVKAGRSVPSLALLSHPHPCSTLDESPHQLGVVW